MPNSHRIPLETAHRFLASFGITSPTKEYERWVKEDGFDFEDFPTVLYGSPFRIGVDWRAALEDELGLIAEGLAKLNVVLEFDIDPLSNHGTVSCGDRTEKVKFNPSDGDDFTAVIATLQSIVPANIEFRESPSNGSNDGWEFAVLPRDEWAELAGLDPELLNSLYGSLE